MRAIVGWVLVPVWVASLATNAHADQDGVPFWFSGSYASLAAVPANPGWSLVMKAFRINGTPTSVGPKPPASRTNSSTVRNA